MSIPRLKKRRSFLAIAGSGKRFSSPSFLLQSKEKQEGDGEACFGFTATRRLGKAVQRNRARRRLKAAVELILQEKFPFIQSNDYVLIARPDIFTVPFEKLVMTLKKGLNYSPSSQKIAK